MDMQQFIKPINYRRIIHWIALGIYICIFGYAGLYKIFGVPGMMDGMAAIGFDKTWTLFIGCAEVLGVISLIIGLFIPAFKRLAILGLFPFAIGAFTIHMSYQHTFSDFREALLVCVLSVIILWTDEKFKVIVK